jgi:hypothetical protein
MTKSRLMIAVVAGLSLLLPFASFATPAAAAPAADPVVTLKILSSNGAGCPAGSSVSATVPSQEAFTVSYSQFRVLGGDYKNCLVTMQVTAPPGWTYAVYSVDNRGYGVLDEGARARIQNNSWFTGFSWTLTSDGSVTGPFDDFWQTTNSGPLLFAPCNRSFNLNINSTLRVVGPATSSMELFATDVRASIIYHLQWKRCP